MTYLEDLSTRYFPSESVSTEDGLLEYQPDYELINVGWLGEPHPVPSGPTPEGFLDALLDIIAERRLFNHG